MPAELAAYTRWLDAEERAIGEAFARGRQGDAMTAAIGNMVAAMAEPKPPDPV